VRSFPSASGRRVAPAALVATALVLATLAIPALADDDLKDKQRRVEQQIDHAHDDLEHSSKALQRASTKLADAQAQLRTARGKLTDVRGRLADAQEVDARMQIELTGARHQLMLATAELAEGAYAVDLQRGQVRDTVSRFYTQGDPRLTAFASYIEARSPSDLMSRMATENAVVGHQTSVYADLDDAEELLVDQQEKVEDAKERVADRRREAADHLEVVEGLFQDAQDAKVAVDNLVSESRDARRAAFNARKADRAALQRLKNREANIRRQILAAAKAAGGATYNGNTGGLLAYPVNGSVTSPYGYRTHPIYGYYSLHNGTDFGAGCGSPVFAGAAGTVTSTYFDEVYGNRLYLSVGTVNGANLTLVYNHMSGYNASEGARVGRGDVIGYVGTTGWSTGCHMHFTVLRNGNPVDPMPYL
jgi:murein DD-endopeptidase MepM/ murein hydrolase activator NlpD